MMKPIIQKFKNSFYNTIILDVDGVIFDSNKTKENNIYMAVKQITNSKVANEFTPYFMRLSGIPREQKINSFFTDEPELAYHILKYYNNLNEQSLYKAELTKHCTSFIKYCNTGITLIALSGGALSEIEKLFDIHKLTTYFTHIFGGPKSKDENIATIKLIPPVLYIGDSKVDYDTSIKLNADFAFMYGYTSFQDWQTFVKNKDQIEIIKDLQELII